jgi:hypothetical protein
MKSLIAALIIAAARLSGVQCNIDTGVNNCVAVGTWGTGNAHCFVLLCGNLDDGFTFMLVVLRMWIISLIICVLFVTDLLQALWG